jgi:hypothetical protein
MLTSNTSDGMKAYNMATPAGLNAVSGAPDARFMFPANNQLVALGDGATALNRLSVSAFGDHTKWSSQGAAKQDLDGGAFAGGGNLGNGTAILLQNRAVRKMTFGNAGGGALFRLDTLADDVGCVHPRAHAVYNGSAYFLHTDGFWLTNGGPPVNIGAGKVNLWFLARCPDLTKVSAAVDPKNTIIRWRYPAAGDGSSATVFNSYLDYNWVANEFVPGIEPTAAIFRMGAPVQTLDSLDSFGELNDWSQYPVDSAVWQGGNFRLAGLDADYKFGFFDGGAAAAVTETPTQSDGRSQLVNRLRLISDDATATVQLGVKNDIAESVTWKLPTAKVGQRYPVRGRGIFQRYRINHAAGATWTKDQGITEIEAAAGGAR